MAATAAKAVIDFIDEQQSADQCRRNRRLFARRVWRSCKAKHSLIGDVRGMGLMQAIELVEDRESRAPAPEATAALMEAARENRLLIGKGGMYGNVIRISPPLNISKSRRGRFRHAGWTPAWSAWAGSALPRVNR